MSASTKPHLTMDELLAVVARAAEELFTVQLGCRGFSIVGRSTGVAVTDVGSYVALVGDEQSAQIGLVASIDTCRMLARQMLAMDEGEELDDGDMCDAIGEIANILGGTTKRLMHEQTGPFKLGLPLFMQGRLIASERQEVGSLTIRIGSAVANLIVLRMRRR
jgi:CheY-specific phosphatase CheX